jgi:ubiquinone/menaquinone biosynthesis C-methylase UbiE
MPQNPVLGDLIGSSNKHTDDYQNDPDFKTFWSGTNPKAVQLHNQIRHAFSEMINPVFPSLSGLKILDFGCGTGMKINWLLEMGADIDNVYGIDIHQPSLDAGLKINRDLNLAQYDGVNIPYDSNSFDLVTCFTVFMVIPTSELRLHLAAEIERVLKPGGYIFWWDLFHTTAPADFGAPLNPNVLWQRMDVREDSYGQLPKPGATLRPLKGIGKYLRPALNKLGHKESHMAALIGPKHSSSKVPNG